MRAYTFDVREALLRSAKAEFLQCGFEKASLRTICKNAGVTTGAFYAYFEKKDDLFAAIVDPVLEKFDENCQFILEKQRQKRYTTGDSELCSVEFLAAHREEAILLLDCAAGTKYENFQKEVLAAFMQESYQIQMDFHAEKPVDPNLVRILLRMKLEAYRQILYGGYDRQEVRKLVRYLTSFTQAGVIQLMQELQANQE